MTFRQRVSFLAILLSGSCLCLIIPAAIGIQDASFFGLWRARHLAAAGILFAASLPIVFSLASHRAGRLCLHIYWQLGVTVLLLEIIGLAGLVNYSLLMKNAIVPTNQLGAEAKSFLDVSGETSQDIATFRGIEHPGIPFRYQTGRHGFRNPYDPDDPQVYLVGDSIVVGATVDYEQTIGGIIRRESEHETLNVALIGLGIQQQRALLSETALPIENRLIIQFVFEGNDLTDSRNYRAAANIDQDEGLADRLSGRSFLNNLVVLSQRLIADPQQNEPERSGCSLADQPYEFLYLSNSFEGLEEEQFEVTTELSKIVHEVETAGGKLGIVYVPTKFRVVGHLCEWGDSEHIRADEHLSPFRDVLQEWSQTNAVPFLDLTIAFSDAARQGRIPYYWGDTHLNETGHEIAAAEILDWRLFSEWSER